MINRQMQRCEIWEEIETKSKWGSKAQESLIGTLSIAINHISGTNIKNDLSYTEVTHLGLTRHRGLKVGQRLKTADNKVYLVEKPPNELGRLAQVYLKEVV